MVQNGFEPQNRALNPITAQNRNSNQLNIFPEDKYNIMPKIFCKKIGSMKR